MTEFEKRYRSFVMMLANIFINWLRSKKHFGALRFKIERQVLKSIYFFPKSRSERQDFILRYLPELKMVYWVDLPVLEIGCVDSLLIHEIKRRGYRSYGMDIREYNSALPDDITFINHDILKSYELCNRPEFKFMFIVATGVIELLGCGLYGDEQIPNADRIALENIYDMLLDEGYFLITVLTHGWRGATSRGYGLGTFSKLIGGLFHPFEITQYGGHICAALVKIKKTESK